MKKNKKDHEIDLKNWLFKFKSKWYLFVAFALVSLAFAYVYVKTSPRVYEFKSTLLLGDQQTGSKKAQELLEVLQVQSKGIKVEDEIGLLQSAEVIKQALKQLDFSVAYYKVTDHWLNNFGDLIVEEQYESAPYLVNLDTTSYQLVDVPLVVRVLDDKTYEISIEGKDVSRYDFRQHSVVEALPEVNFKKQLKFGEPYKSKFLSFTIERNDMEDMAPGKEYFFVINSLESLVKQQQAALQVAPIEREARVLVLKTRGSIPEKQLTFLNKLMETYVARDLEEKNQNGLKTLEFIDSQLATLTDSLRRSKQALSSFRSSNRIANINVQSNISYEKLSQLEAERARLNTDKAYYETILDQVQNGNGIAQSVSPTVAGIQSPILNNLFLQLADLNQKKAGYRVTATADNPMLRKIEGEIESTRGAIVANLKNLIRSANISINDVNRRISGIESNLASLPENERKLMDLQSESEFIDKKYDFLLAKRSEAAIALATNTTDKKIVDQASMMGNTPVNVKPKMIYLLALLIGLAIPAGFIVLMDNVDNTIQGKDDLSNTTNIPFLGVVAHGSKADKLAVQNTPRSAIAESFRSIRINLQYLMSNSNFKVIGITSSVSGEGKTFCSVNLSSELALSGKRVVLIESDMRKPTFTNYFNASKATGLSSFLTQGLPLQEVVQKTQLDNLDVIPCGPIPNNAIQLLELPKMQELIDLLKDEYDYVVIDTPPIGFVSEYFVLMRHMDVNLYVVKHKYTDKDLLTQVNELYAAKKIKNIYMIINDLNYSNTYEYGYKRKAKYYYV
ncbi:capsular exopolysaccharide synthesis family protein [Pontibacter ummariensis]|uniref:non-specific protein-tyrosine kinase n=1 Tax=Pontibacter ummariensis TaxID=1610492 RepID=A0A239GFY6_9BACT|nr:polysaccharide biosynthesis tyrosine autokinase [Pontibacter ummariensis]PRY11244.1 capsular exopolysaccharide synthesis family protein [Pontibacter ummariensis]SNS67961.1 capsular exopolysaccharide family [Pontibacter ummariensis]